MPGRCQPHFESRFGTIAMGLAFLVNSLFMAIPNGTLMYQAMEKGGVVNWIGCGLFLGGAMVSYGAFFPCRKIRQIGQCICFLMGWWILLAAIQFDVIPATPMTLAILGTGLLAILIRDAFAGVTYRNHRRSFDRRHVTQGV